MHAPISWPSTCHRWSTPAYPAQRSAGSAACTLSERWDVLLKTTSRSVFFFDSIIVARIGLLNVESCDNFQIYEAQPLISPAIRYLGLASDGDLVAMVMATILPPKEIWSCITTGIKVARRNTLNCWEIHRIVAYLLSCLGSWKLCILRKRAKTLQKWFMFTFYVDNIFFSRLNEVIRSSCLCSF